MTCLNRMFMSYIADWYDRHAVDWIQERNLTFYARAVVRIFCRWGGLSCSHQWNVQPFSFFNTIRQCFSAAADAVSSSHLILLKLPQSIWIQGNNAQYVFTDVSVIGVGFRDQNWKIIYHIENFQFSPRKPPWINTNGAKRVSNAAVWFE